MAMDLARAFHSVVQLTVTAPDAAAGWSRFVLYLESVFESSLPTLTTLDIEADVASVRSQLGELLTSEPPPSDVDAVYFGLFDTVDEDDQPGIGYCISGIVGFDPEDGDSLCDPAWWPVDRYLRSSALDAIKTLEVAAGAAGNADLREFLSYAGQLGAAVLVSRFASVGVLPARRRVVGFDSGDFASFDDCHQPPCSPTRPCT
jgi:hypothetical protein